MRVYVYLCEHTWPTVYMWKSDNYSGQFSLPIV